jgi:TetR/AcrR family transcriptional regulator, lmrAB and yxaGH operons repressor
MPPSSSDTRARLLDNGAQLFGRYGFTGTGLKAILDASDAPFGSLYHFFAGGKEELGAEAARQSGRNYLSLVEAFYPVGNDVVAGTQQFFEVAAQVLEVTEYVEACQIATVALEVANTSEPMREACAEAFDSWLSLLQTRFMEAGIEDKRASELAIQLFCAVEVPSCSAAPFAVQSRCTPSDDLAAHCLTSFSAGAEPYDRAEEECESCCCGKRGSITAGVSHLIVDGDSWCRRSGWCRGSWAEHRNSKRFRSGTSLLIGTIHNNLMISGIDPRWQYCFICERTIGDDISFA